MSRTGRVLRQKMIDDSLETPERARERRCARKAGELAVAAREAKFPELTAANAGEAMAYQETVLRSETARLMREGWDA